MAKKKFQKKKDLTLCRALVDLGFHVSDTDQGVFYAHDGNDITGLAIYVDDYLITKTSYEPFTNYRQRLGTIFALTYLGGIHWLLGIKISATAELAPYHSRRHVIPTPFSNASHYPM